jgi:diaminohydroxyphosphoribosylaminopyrimidine deaminase/5-amino-6-(5-phosphoribosylamino)uracil reductase
MQRALELAKHGQLHVSPNPMVGCVIVYQGEIIGEGYHTAYGKPHAEVNAIASVKNKELLKESTLYVTLEPCSHFGKTPPCADLIIENKIPHVVVAVLDPNPKVQGNGIEKLKKAGCKVETGILEKEAKELNKRFFCFHERKRPYIILKWAQTLDGFLDCNERGRKNRENYWITNDYLRYKVHQWRAEEDAIFAGANTILHDNPQLNVRYSAGKNPVRATFFSKLTNTNFHIFDNSQMSIIFNLDEEEQRENTCFYKLTDKNNIWQEIIPKLYELKIQSLLVEGGQNTLQQLIDLNLWDEARILIGNTCFGSGLKTPHFPFIPEEIENVGGDKVLFFENK